MSRSNLVTGGNILHLRDNEEQGNLIGDIRRLPNLFQCVIIRDNFERNSTIRKRFMWIAGDAEDGSMLSVAGGLIPFHKRFRTDRGARDFVFLQYMENTPTLHEVDKAGCWCLKYRTTDENDHRAFIGEKINNKTKLNVS